LIALVDAVRLRRCRGSTLADPREASVLRYPADPPKVEEIVSVMREAGNDLQGRRLRGLTVVLWRAGLRIQEALALAEADLDHRRGALLVRCGKGGRRREAAWTRGAGMSSSHGSNYESSSPSARCSVSSTAGRVVASGRAPPPEASCGAQPSQRGRRRLAPHQLRHAHAVEMAREGVPLVVIQRQLGHSNLGITSVYLQGIDNAEIIDTVHARRAPMIPVSTSRRL
jgi:site-specific recombinase XerD